MTPPAPIVLTEGQPVELPASRFYDFRSALTGRDHRLFVHVPEGAPPEGGFPVVYVLDGNWWFGTFLESARSRGIGHDVLPAVIVGVGYTTNDWMAAGALRFKDLSTPATQAWLDAMAYPIPGLTADMTGGVDAFLQVLETEIKPAVAALAPVDPRHQSVFGHSLAGLAVLRALFTAPRSFRSFIASSPSIWWSDRALLEGEAAFAEAVRARRAEPRVLIDVGGLEQTVTPAAVRVMQSEAAVEASLAQARMVDNAEELGARLAALDGGPGYTIASVTFPDEGHGSVVAPAISRAISFALSLP